MASKMIEVLVFAPSVPLEETPNGVCTYVRRLNEIFKDNEKILINIIAKRYTAVGSGIKGVYEYYLRDKSLFRRILLKLIGVKSYENSMAKKFGRYVGKKSKYNHCVIEMEEVFGQSLTVKKYMREPMILRLHGPWFLVGPYLVINQDDKFHRRVIREGQAIFEADAVSAPSEFVLNAVEKYYGKEIRNKIVLPNPFPVYLENDLWNFTSEDQTILFVGRFDMYKGADVFIEAMFKLAVKQDGACMVFVGPNDGWVKNGNGIKMNLSEFIDWCEKKYEIMNPIQFVGKKEPKEIVQLRKKAGVCVIASRMETFCYTVAESMAQGVPTVASRTGSIPELIEDDVDGLLFENENPNHLADCVERILSDHSLAVKLSKNALRTASEKFSGEKLTKTYSDFYRQVAEHKP